ncbi:hypothetical protein [Prescottella equi]
MALPTLTATQMPLLIDALAEKSRAGRAFALLHEGVYLEHLTGTAGAETRAFAAMHRIPVSEAFPLARATAVGDHPQLPEDTVQVLTWMRESYSALVFAAKGRHAYFAVEETTALILAGAQQTVTEHSVAVSDLPSPNGVAYLHHADEPLVLAWSTFGGVVSVSICTAEAARTHLLDETEPVSPPLPVASFRLSADGTDTAPVPILDGIEDCVDLQWGDGKFDHYAAPRAIPVFLSFMHMLRQDRLIDREEVAARTPAATSGSGRGRGRSRGAAVTFLRYSGRRTEGADGVWAEVQPQVGCTRALAAPVVSECATARPDLDHRLHRRTG